MKRFTDQEKEIILFLREEQGLTCQAIADQLGRPVGSVINYCFRNFIQEPHPVRRRAYTFKAGAYKRKGRAVRPFTPEDDATLLAMEAQRASYGAIAKKLKRRHHSVSARLIALANRDEMKQRNDVLAVNALRITYVTPGRKSKTVTIQDAPAVVIDLWHKLKDTDYTIIAVTKLNGERVSVF